MSLPISHSFEVTIDDFRIEGKYHPLRVKVPSPEAYIFHKGLIFERRKDRLKMAKDLYYIFEILSNCPELRERIIEGLNGFQKAYSSWFSRFIGNLQKTFFGLTANGILMVSSQRPAGAFPKLTDDQLKEYILGIFQEFIEEVTTGR